MFPKRTGQILHPLRAAFLLLVLAACSLPNPAPTLPSPSPIAATQPAPTTTPTQASPTATDIPLAARVNGDGIPLAEFQADLKSYQTSQPGTTNGKDVVLDDLIDTTLLAQGATEAGFKLDDAAIQSRLDALAAKAGGQGALTQWQVDNGYDPVSFRQSLARSIAAAWMRDQIMASVPTQAEQVHARQILLYNSDQAQQVLAQIKAGTDFATLAYKYDATGGDLGWFPRGYLTEPALDDAIFALQPGQHTDIIETRLGFHIVQVIERDSQRLLDPQALLALQRSAVQSWVQNRRSQSKVELLAP